MLYSIIKKMLVVTGVVAASTTLLLSVTNTAVAACPAATVADMKGVKAGKYPQQFELSEFERLAGCKLCLLYTSDAADE